MTLKEKIKQMEALGKKTENFRRNIIPVKAGDLAVNHFQGNFLRSGYQDRALVKWKKTVRQEIGGGSAAAQYGPLTSATNRLKNAFYYQTGDMRVTVVNPQHYARYHNEGATAKVTARMKKFAWHKYFEAAGIQKGKKREQQGEPGGLAGMWKAIALKKTGSTIHLPQRRFMGKAGELVDKIKSMAGKELLKQIRG